MLMGLQAPTAEDIEIFKDRCDVTFLLPAQMCPQKCELCKKKEMIAFKSVDLDEVPKNQPLIG